MGRPGVGRGGGRSWKSGAHRTLRSSILQAGQATDEPRACGPATSASPSPERGGRRALPKAVCPREALGQTPKLGFEPQDVVRQKKLWTGSWLAPSSVPNQPPSLPQSEPLLLSHLKQRRPALITSKNPTSFMIHISGIFLK